MNSSTINYAAVKTDSVMVEMARKMANHFGHGWVWYEGETLQDVLDGMREYTSANQHFDAGITPYLFLKNGSLCLGHTSETGRFDWRVNEKGTMVCNIRRPAGLAIVIAISMVDGQPQITIRRTSIAIEHRHISAAADIVRACAGEQYVEVAMKKFLGEKAFIKWSETVSKEHKRYLQDNFPSSVAA